MIRYLYYFVAFPGVIINCIALFTNIPPAFTSFEMVMIMLGAAILEYLEEFRKNQVEE